VSNPAGVISTAFFGTPSFAAIILEELTKNSAVKVKVVVTQPDAKAGRGKKLTHSPVFELATKLGIPILQPHSLKKEKKSFLESLAPFGQLDISVVAAYGQLIPIDILNIARAGSVNIHASLLPRWRGAAPIHRAILAGDTQTGVCLMKMEAGLDTGATYSRELIPISSEDSVGSLHDKLAALGAKLISRDIVKIARGEINSTPQPSEGITYAAKISNEECEINWTDENVAIHRRIRSLSPFPGAFTFLEGKRLKIYSCALKTNLSDSAKPGSIVAADRDRVEVQCGQGIVALNDVQLQDRKRMGIKEFMRGAGINTGAILGS